MEMWKKAIIGLGIIGIGLFGYSRWRQQGGCFEGETKTIDCNQCMCIGGRWMCTMRDCVPPEHVLPDESLMVQPIQIEAIEDRRSF